VGTLLGHGTKLSDLWLPVRIHGYMALFKGIMKEMLAAEEANPGSVVDRDFVAMMVPHHQGAVDMAKAELKYGHSERLRRLAQQIVAMQQQEIKVMQDAVSDGSSAAQPRAELSAQSVPTDGAVAHGGMQMKMSQ